MNFTIYSKPSCQFCDQAKSLLASKGLQYSVVNLDVGQPKLDGEKYIDREELLRLFPSARTVPQITVETDNSALHLGGYAELVKYLKERTL